MQYRPLGKTGLNVSVIGLGGEHLDGKPYETVKSVIDTALDGGVNIMDVFMPGAEIRQNIGKALGSRRKDIIIQGHIGSVDLERQYDITRDLATCKRYFEDLLRHLRTDYIDLGMLFFLDDDQAIDAMLNNGVVAYAQKLKEQGTIRVIGASAHNPKSARRVIESGLVDMMLFSINPAFDLMPDNGDIENMLGNSFTACPTRADPERAAFYRLCASRQIGLTVMKPLGAGKLLSPDHTPFAKPLTAGQCFHYALTRPAVASVLPGCKTREEMLEALNYLDLSPEEKDFSAAIASFRRGKEINGGFKGNCVYCSHCLPCPVNIDIAVVNKYLDIARLNPGAIPPSIVSHYRHLAHSGQDCVACGSCEERCPFSVAIMDNMRQAAELLGGK